MHFLNYVQEREKERERMKEREKKRERMREREKKNSFDSFHN